MKLTGKLFIAVLIGNFANPAFLRADQESNGPKYLKKEEVFVNEYDQKLEKLFDTYWDWRMKDNPMDATWVGYPGLNHLWPNLTIESINQSTAQAKQLLHELLMIDVNALSKPENKISYEVLTRILNEKIELANFEAHLIPIEQMHGIHLSIPMILELAPKSSVEDYKNLIFRLESLDTLIDQVIELLKIGLSKEITPPKITLKNISDQISNQIPSEAINSPLLMAFKQMPESFSKEERENLLKQAEKAYFEIVVPSYSKLKTYLVEKYIPNCRESTAFTTLPNGQEWYESLVRSFTTTSLCPKEIHEIGLKEVQRIHSRIDDLLASLNFNGHFLDFLKYLESNSKFYFENKESILLEYRKVAKHIESKLGSLFSDLPVNNFEIVPVPEYCEKSQIAAYYCPGSLIDKRPGYFYVNTSFPETRPKWEVEPLALHEAVPGHHLQISLAQELTGLPPFRKNGDYTAYIEGWGLYAEGLGYDLDCYKDPYSQFGRLSYEMLRAIRLVVDTGMHALGWSRERAIQFFHENVDMTAHEIETEVDRYLVIPGQALAYKIGELKILELKGKAKSQLGSKFDIKEFHKEWLRHGALPLNIAEQIIDKWIEEKLKL